MNHHDFWNEISSIIGEGFTDQGLAKLEYYAELFINQQIVYKRFSPFEQHGCTTGGITNVVATLLAGTDVAAKAWFLLGCLLQLLQRPWGPDLRRVGCGYKFKFCILELSEIVFF